MMIIEKMGNFFLLMRQNLARVTVMTESTLGMSPQYKRFLSYFNKNSSNTLLLHRTFPLLMLFYK